MRADLPAGTVTFLFTDMEGSTQQLQRLGEGYASLLATQRKLLRAAFDKFHGREVDIQGDSFFVAFARAADAIAASVMGQRALVAYAGPAGETVRVRMGLHTGAPQLTTAGYVGLDVHIAARLCAAAHGGQVLVSQATRDLVEQLPLDNVSLRDLGEHRLKDLDQPRRIFQLVISELPDTFPPLRSLDALPHNLPIQLTSFVGRELEIEEVKRLLNTTRLLTLTGAGGAGKTRLALQVAADLVESYDDGVWLIELAPLADPALMPQAVAAVLGVRGQPGQPILNSLVEHLRPKNMLLVLDNCEHLIDACARVSDSLLRACPDLRILATSREALGIAGETAWTVPSLSLPDVHQPRPMFADLSQYEAVQLFVDRAVAVQPSFKLTELNASPVARICQQLDGIPLALELAAARVKVLKTAEIAARLDDRFTLLTLGSRTTLPRHQTLRAAIDWSYDLLTEPERVMLRRLSVFAGGCTLEAAEAVCQGEMVSWREGEIDALQPSITPSLILDLLSHLVDKSLVLVDKQGVETRYWMLETIREYASSRLEESGEADAIRQHHAEFFLDLAERIPPTMTGDERKARYARFDVEQDNCRAALGWALATQHAELGLRLIGELGEYWYWWTNSWHEGWSWISRFLALPTAQHFPHARANALKVAIKLLNYVGENTQAIPVANEGLALFRELGDKTGTAWMLAEKGFGAWLQADFPEAVMLFDESVTLFREVGDLRGLARALTWRATIARELAQFEKAAVLFDESIAAAREVGDDTLAGIAYFLLGGLAYYTGDYERAADLQHKAITLCRQAGHPNGTYMAVWHLGRIALAQGDLDSAASQFEASEAWFRQAQRTQGLSFMLHHLGYVRHLQGDDRTASALLGEALALQQQQQLILPLIQSLERCAWVSADTHQPQRAARLFGAAETARARIGAPLPPGEKPPYDRHLARARAELDRQKFHAEWAEGRAMTLEQAIEYALEFPLLPEHGIPQRITRQVAKKEFNGLTEREREVAARIAQGESNREIAEVLVVSERTVETHVTNIHNKLGFTSRAQIRKWAAEKGLVKRVE